MGLGLPPSTFEGEGGTTADSSYWVARAIHYPPLPEFSPFAASLSPAGIAPMKALGPLLSAIPFVGMSPAFCSMLIKC